MEKHMRMNLDEVQFLKADCDYQHFQVKIGRKSIERMR